MGENERGFDILSYHLAPKLIGLSHAEPETLLVHIARLYEQGVDEDRTGRDIRNWFRWLLAGVVVETLGRGGSRYRPEPGLQRT